ncbi:ATP-grasp domain-containing protein [Pontibacter chitinilyticus]|uniref:ATP-grasp domain-containing protein n=1 Tax=Pontibacter chitinilyticus TaxID=2674989 RepID=UPI00321AFC0E
MHIQQIALITYKSTGSYSGISEEENDHLFHFLQEKGLPVSFQVWDDPAVDWSRFDAVIMKSPWDYFDKIDAFYTWLDTLETIGMPVLNPLQTIRWNADKLYFKDLVAKGIEVVPTVWLNQGEPFRAAQVIAELGVEKIIVKPRVSGGAKNTLALTAQQAESRTAEIDALLQQEPFMAQPYLPEIAEKGEWSFLFFGGKYSHTVLKTAKAGDFRVQHFFGGTVHTFAPPAALLATAQHIIDTFAADCLYARVDGVELDGRFVLMELELIEPYLFMATSPGAIDRYYEALQGRLQALRVC